MRTVRGQRLAYAPLAEPVAPAVERERLAFRRAHHELFAGLLRDCVEQGELPPQDVDVAAAALTGAISEALVAPLSPAQGASRVRIARRRSARVLRASRGERACPQGAAHAHA
ncbi:MAG: hypothetical protein GEU81_12585 [Nitriliruptorales bacterium]|nr:hypothetical protein [Nitriliruptorales bacterium]